MTLPPNEAPTVEDTVARMNFIAETNPFDATRQWCADAASLLTTLQAALDTALADGAQQFEANLNSIERAEAAEAERDALRTRVERLTGALDKVTDLFSYVLVTPGYCENDNSREEAGDVIRRARALKGDGSC